VPTTYYARSGDLSIAYQVIGDGPRDLVYVPGFVSNVDVMWEDPIMSRFLNRLASFARLIIFDKRGTGLSDGVPIDQLPTIEERMDDVRAVMDAVGSERASLLGHSEGGNMSTVFAATYPERTDSLILVSTYAKRIPSSEYPWAPDPSDRQAEIEEISREWGRPDFIPDWLVPKRSTDPAFREWAARYFRHGASPTAAAHLMRMNTQIDTTEILKVVRVPALCIYRTEDHDVKIEEGRWIAGQIPDARLVELPGDAHFIAEDLIEVMDEVEHFVTGQLTKPEPDRMLATVLFTDIVDSTKTMSSIGDSAWRELLERHHHAVRVQLERWQGAEVDTAGDGFFATFDGPARAVNAAHSIVEAVRELGIDLRAGLHTGEVEVVDGKAAGTAVHIGARVSSLAAGGEVLVSRTVKDLVAGSGLKFEDRGVHTLKGIPDEWQVYASI
jgi:class 3 adenylate cyclase